MKILIVLTYYRPHISGLTIYAERLAKAFARRGHQVTILTSQFKKELPSEEVVEGCADHQSTGTISAQQRCDHANFWLAGFETGSAN